MRPVPRLPTLAAAALLLYVAMALCAAPARADRIDTLADALRSDPSWRVKVQAAITLGKLKARDPRAIAALVEVLKHDNEAVRAVAAETLGIVGDRSALEPLRAVCTDESPGVRVSAKKSVAILEKAPDTLATVKNIPGPSTGPAPAAPAAHWYVELSDIAPGKGDAEAAKKIHDIVVRELGGVTGVSLDPAATGVKARYYVDANITALGAGKPDDNGRVHTDCGVRLLLASLPDKSIRMMATLESSVEGTTDPKDLASARNDCIVDAARQIAEKVQAYLETHR